MRHRAGQADGANRVGPALSSDTLLAVEVRVGQRVVALDIGDLFKGAARGTELELRGDRVVA